MNRKAFEGVAQAYQEVKKTIKDNLESFMKKFEGTKSEASQEAMDAKTPEDLRVLGKKLMERADALETEQKELKKEQAEGKEMAAETGKEYDEEVETQKAEARQLEIDRENKEGEDAARAAELLKKIQSGETGLTEQGEGTKPEKGININNKNMGFEAPSSEGTGKKLSSLAESILKDARKKGDYSELSREQGYIPEMQNKTFKEKVDFLVEQGIDPTQVRIMHAKKDGEESLPGDYRIEAMAKNPNMVPALYDHLQKRDLKLPPKQQAIAILGIINNGDKSFVETDSFKDIMESMDKSYQKEFSQALQKKGYEGLKEQPKVTAKESVVESPAEKEARRKQEETYFKKDWFTLTKNEIVSSDGGAQYNQYSQERRLAVSPRAEALYKNPKTFSESNGVIVAVPEFPNDNECVFLRTGDLEKARMELRRMGYQENPGMWVPDMNADASLRKGSIAKQWDKYAENHKE